MPVVVLCSLPVQSAGREMVVAEAIVKGKKGSNSPLCLEVFQLLDNYGVLSQTSQSEYHCVCLYVHVY